MDMEGNVFTAQNKVLCLRYMFYIKNNGYNLYENNIILEVKL